jgi:hypothetical protein
VVSTFGKPLCLAYRRTWIVYTQKKNPKNQEGEGLESWAWWSQYSGGRDRRISAQGQPGKISWRPYLKNKQQKCWKHGLSGRVLPSKCETLSLIPSTTKKKKKEGKKLESEKTGKYPEHPSQKTVVLHLPPHSPDNLEPQFYLPRPQM